MIPSLLILLLTAALRALLAALTVALALRLLGIRQVRLLKAVWSLVLAAALLLPFWPGSALLPSALALRLPLPSSGSMTARQTQRPTNAPAMQPAASAAQMNEAWRQYAELTAEAKANPQPEGLTRAAAGRWFALPMLVRTAAFVWMAVAAALVLRLLLGLAAALRLWHKARPASFAADVRLSERLASPVSIGHGVLLPAEAAGWSDETLRIVLAHERAHVAQYDFYLQILAGLYAALYWPSPLGWWLKHKLYALGEALSDHAGLSQAASRASYAQLLLEFAALPRPTVPGVAMARTNHLSDRIERLLNESSFRHAFTPSRRAVLALAMIPAALIAATSLVHVQAAALQEPSAQQPDQPLPPPPPQNQPPQAQLPPPPPQGNPGQFGPQQGPQGGPQAAGFGPQAGGPNHGEGYILVGEEKPQPEAGRPGFGPGFGPGPGQPPAEIEKARKLAKGHFLLFQHEGKSYLVDDAAALAPIEALEQQIGAFHNQMRAEADKQFAAEHKAEVKVPDVARQIDELNKALATLRSKQTVSEAELITVQRQLFELERRLDQGHPGEAPGAGPQAGPQGAPGPRPQGGPQGAPQFGPQQQPGPNFAGGPGFKGNEAMAKLGEQLNKAIRDKDEKVRALISESLKNGKARLVS